MKVFAVVLVLALAACSADAAARSSMDDLLRTEPSSAFDDMRFADSLLMAKDGDAADAEPSATAEANVAELNNAAEESQAERATEKAECAAACEQNDKAEALIEAENQDELARKMKNRDSVMDEIKSLETLLRHANDISSAIPAKQSRLDALKKQLGMAETGTLETQAKGEIQHKEHLLKKIEAEMQELEERTMDLGAEKQKIVQELKTLYLESKGLSAEQAQGMLSKIRDQGMAQGVASAEAKRASGAWKISANNNNNNNDSGKAASGDGADQDGDGDGEPSKKFMFI